MTQEYVGAVKLFAGNFAPRQFAVCQGATMAISQNQALFALLGTIYGGNGTTTFQLPNLASRAPIGVGQNLQGSNYVIGQIGGVENVMLSQATTPSHTHTFNASTSATTSSTAGPTVVVGALKAADHTFYATPGQTGFTPARMNANAVSAQGGMTQHSNIQASLGINYIIALFGVFPSRN
jgi:microcystin-dependent protein